MKIDRLKLKRSSSEVPLDCKVLIEQLKACNEDQLLETLKSIRAWSCGKCELYHWIDILDIFDSILEECCARSPDNKWVLAVDLPENAKKRELLLHVIGFTSLLIEHSFSRHLYSSIEHLVSLLASTDMKIVLQILNLLFVFSKRSNFFSRISAEKRNTLLLRLKYLTQNWCSKENGFGLANCCQDLPLESLPESATSLNFKYNLTADSDKPCGALSTIHISQVHTSPHSLPELMNSLCIAHPMNEDQQMQLFTQLRLAKNFADYPSRLKCIQARLVALSIIVYCQSNTNIGVNEDGTNVVITNPIIEELVDVLELDNKDIIEIKSASLRTLTSITHHDRSSKMRLIIEKTGAASYHGFLPIMVRNCINSLIEDHTTVSISFATALFSFLYHLASYEAGCEALVQCGIMESLLKVIDWKEPESDHITFVTRAVRVIDLITNLDMTVFLNFNGLNIFLKRLDNEVDTCRKDQPFEIEVPADKINKLKASNEEEAMKSEGSSTTIDSSPKSPMDVEVEGEIPVSAVIPVDKSLFSPEVTCFPQRAALLKSMLNFLKRAIQHSGISEALRNLLHGSFVPSMRHIVSNAEYYGPSLFMLTTDVISGYVFNEPSLLSTLQENGLTDVILYALLVKDVPPTKEVLSSLPNVFTALCLNHNGLEAFVALKPFDRLFKIFLSPDYLPAMRRRRNDNNGNDTATSLGNAMDELMRHQPSLRLEAILAIIKLLEAICKLGSDSKYTCSKSKSDDSIVTLSSKPPAAADPEPNQNVSNEISSEEEDDFFDTATGVATAVSIPPPPEDIDCSNSQPTSEETMAVAGSSRSKEAPVSTESKESIPLQEYIYNAMRFVDAILSNNSTEDHCREFLKYGGLVPLFKILRLPNLPPDFPTSSPCNSVASVFKSLLALTQDKTIFGECLKNFKEVVDQLDGLCSNGDFKGSALLDDLITTLSSKRSNSVVSPTLQTMCSIHAYIIVFIQICRTGQTEIRSIANDQWGSKTGLAIIEKLSKIYVTLVWESTLLLGLNDSVPPSLSGQIEVLNSILKLASPETGEQAMEVDVEVSADGIPPADSRSASTQASTKPSKKVQPKNFQLNKMIKPVLDIASRLGRSLAELFNLLVKLCVGSPIRRRSNHVQPKDNVPSKQSRDIAKYLNGLLQYGLSWKPPADTNIPKYMLTFYVCSIGFSTPMLLDDRKQPYHLMLQNFVFQGGHDSFFECFDSIIGKCDYFKSDQKVTELSNGVSEFLDSWLLLLEKLTNPKNLLESAHSMPEKDPKPNSKFIPFDPYQFMIRTHRKAFACIKMLWNERLFKINSDNIVSLVLQIISNLICGETCIEKHASKDQNQAETDRFIRAPPSPSNRNPNARPSFSDSVTLIQEMGFSREDAHRALIENSNDLQRATDYLLSNNFHNESLRNFVTTNEVEMDPAPDETDSLLWSFTNVPSSKISELSQALTNEVPLEKSELSEFTETILVGIIELLDQLPDTVHKCTSLLVLIAKRNGSSWFEDMILDLIKDLDKFMTIHLNSLQNVLKQVPKQSSEMSVDVLKEVLVSPTTQKLASRTYLLSLLFNQRKNGCALQINRINLLDNVVKTLQQSIQVLDLVNKQQVKYAAPRWICHLIILLDVYEKYAICSKRRREALSSKYIRSWQYFEDKAQTWHSYPTDLNNQIDQAFCSGEENVKFIHQRKRCTIFFNNMSLVYDESGSIRPLMYVLQPNPAKTETEPESEEKLEVKPLSEEMSISVIQMIVDSIKLPLDSETIHALIRLALRLTRFHYNAVLFAELGGITTLLNLTKEANFVGVSVMASIMIRHVIEDEQMLKVSMDKFIRSQANNQAKPVREMHSLLRTLQAAACRDMEIFKESAKSILRINLNHKRFSEVARYSDFLHALPGKDTFKNINLPEVTKNIIFDLLNLLPVKRQEEIKLRQEKSKDECSQKSEPMFSTAIVMFILAELVKSYNNIGKLISDFVYDNVFGVQERTSILAFVLENFLHSIDREDQEIVNSAKSFYSALASVPGYPEIASSIVTEIKISISRIAQLPESPEKHERISNIAQIVLLVVESSPEYAQMNNLHNNAKSYQPYPLPILKLMIKKGMLADMTKLIQTLDFASKGTLTTVNYLLKTLEAISKLVNNSENFLNFALRQGNGRRTLREALEHISHLHLPAQADDVNMENDSNEQRQEEDSQEPALNNEPAQEESSNPPNAADVQLIEIRSRALNSDEVRTDDEEDEHEGNIEDVELGDDIDVAQRDNVGIIDLESSDESSDEDTQSEDAEELVDEEEEEEDDDGGSTQDDHDHEDEDDPMGDDFEEANETQDIQEILSQDPDATVSIRPQINLFDSEFTSYLVNFPALGHDDIDIHIPMPSISNGSGQFSPSLNSDVLIQHPLLTENSDASSLPHVPVNIGQNGGGSVLNFHPLSRSNQRYRGAYYRPSRIPISNIRGGFRLDSIFPQDIFSRRNRVWRTNEELDLLIDNLQFGYSGRPGDPQNFVFNYNAPSPVMTSANLGPGSRSVRWCEEARCLDSDYYFDALFLAKVDICKFLAEAKEEELQKKADKKGEEKGSQTDLSTAPKAASSSDTNTAPDYRGSRLAIRSVDFGQIPNILDLQEQFLNQFQGSVGSINSQMNLEPQPEQPQLQPEPRESIHLPPENNTLDVEMQAAQNIDEPSNEDTDPVLEEQIIVNDPLVLSQEPEAEAMEQAPALSDEPQSQLDANIQNLSVQSVQEQPVPLDAEPIPSTSGTAPNPTYTMTEAEREILGDIEIPEGVDPSFLAALPENLRLEVIAEQLRLQRSTRPSPPTQPDGPQQLFAEVSPEYLAALPQHLQEEVLAQQRQEQQRQQASTAPPDAPVDTAEFFQNLPSSLRRQILADLDDSEIPNLPADIQSEARSLRTEIEQNRARVRSRNLRDLVGGPAVLSRLFGAPSSRIPVLDMDWPSNIQGRRNDVRFLRLPRREQQFPLDKVMQYKGKFLLDSESISALLILLFANIPAGSDKKNKLQKLIRNLCCHHNTRQWIVQSLLDILEKAKESSSRTPEEKDFQLSAQFSSSHPAAWLTLYVDSAFGTRTQIFYLTQKSSKKNQCTIFIHPTTVSYVVQNTLEAINYLSGLFSSHFVSNGTFSLIPSEPSDRKLSAGARGLEPEGKNSPNFFDVLLRQDSVSCKSRKSLKDSKPSSSTSSGTENRLEGLPFVSLISLLSQDFVNKNSVLIDLLLRALNNICVQISNDFIKTEAGSTEAKMGRYSDFERILARDELMKLITDVIINKSCSESGSGDCRSIIVKLSNIFPLCRTIIYKYLFEGVQALGQNVYKDINTLKSELDDFLKKNARPEYSRQDMKSEKPIPQKGSVQDRYSSFSIIINSSLQNKGPSGREVQLPSMSTLINKSSSQHMFLQTLKMIIMIRENEKAPKLAKEKDPANSMETEKEKDETVTRMSNDLRLDHLWESLSDCLCLLSDAQDERAVLVLQPAVEAFFLVHAPEKSDKNDVKHEPVTEQVAHIHENIAGEGMQGAENQDGEKNSIQNFPPETQKFLAFAEKHKVVLNQILRQSTVALSKGPFSVLTEHTRILDFDVKRKYFRQELDRVDHQTRRDDLAIHIRREQVFEDSFREINRKTPEEWKNRFYIVFQGEEGQDAGGLLREWYTIISREIFNPMYALFCTSPGDRVTYMINSSSHCNSNHLSYFKFVGRIIAKAVYDNKLLDCYFTRSFYKHILGKRVKYTDMESEDYAFYQGLVFLLENSVHDFGTDLTFSTEIQEFGVTEVRDLVPNGRNILVTEENKYDYVRLVCQEKMTGSIKKQLNAFLEGFYEIIPKRLISIFNEHELELLISGLPNIDIDDLKKNTQYHKYQPTSLQIQWFWRALRSFDQAERAKFLQFVTGTSKVPLQGFGSLEGMNGAQKFQIHLEERSTDRLPTAHTCFNQLDLPAYETYNKLRAMLLKAINECSEGFGFA